MLVRFMRSLKENKRDQKFKNDLILFPFKFIDRVDRFMRLTQGINRDYAPISVI